MDDQDIRRNWIAAAGEERMRLHAVLRAAQDSGDSSAIAAAKLATEAAQDAHMDAMGVMFPDQFSPWRSKWGPFQERPAMPWAYRRALASLARKFERQFALKLKQIGAFVGASAPVLGQWTDERPNPWRAAMVRCILEDLLQLQLIKPDMPKRRQVVMRTSLFIQYMVSRQLISKKNNIRFNASKSIADFITTLGSDAVADLLKKNEQTANSNHDVLLQDWSKWQNYATLDAYNGDSDLSPRVGAPRKSKPPSESPAPNVDIWQRWWQQLTVDDIAKKAEQRAMRIVRSIVRQINERPAFEDWRWGKICRSTSGGWNVDPLMTGCGIAVEGVYKRGDFEVPAVQIVPFTLELPASAIGLIFAPSDQWVLLKEAGLVDVITNRETMRAIAQIPVGLGSGLTTATR